MEPKRTGPELIAALCRTAAERLAQGQYAQAEPLYRKALALVERFSGSDSIEVARVCNNLGVVCKYSGNFNEAERLYRRALSITEQVLGPEHTEVATLYHNLGGVDHARGRYAAGEPLARRSVEIRQKALGPDHVEAAADMAALAARRHFRNNPRYSSAMSLSLLNAFGNVSSKYLI